MLPAANCGYKTLEAKWLYEFRFSHQSSLYLNIDVDPQSPTSAIPPIVSGHCRTKHQTENSNSEFVNHLDKTNMFIFNKR